MSKTTKDIFRDYFLGKYWDDYSSNFTPDTAELRYEGPIPIFLYSDYSSWSFSAAVMKDEKLDTFECLKFVTNNCMTDNPMVYLRNLSDIESKYKAFLVPSAITNLKGYSLTRHKTRGTLFTVSLKGIQALDRFFFNSCNFERKLIKMAPNDKNIKRAYTWFVKPTLIFDKIEDDEWEVRNGMKLKLPIGASSAGGEIVHL